MESFNLKYLKPEGAATFIGILAISLFLTNQFVSTHSIFSFSVFAILLAILKLINSYGWKSRLFSWLYNLQDFSGEYAGTVFFEFINEKGEKIVDSFNHKKVITQNGSDIVIRSETLRKDDQISSESSTIDAFIVKEKDGRYIIFHNYMNNGNPSFSLSPHYGTERLWLTNSDGDISLKGNYYTNRIPYQTRGEMTLKKI